VFPASLPEPRIPVIPASMHIPVIVNTHSHPIGAMRTRHYGPNGAAHSPARVKPWVSRETD
jgi:hypothetical protein